MFFYGGDNRSKNEAAGFGLDFGGQKGSLDPFTNAFFDNDDSHGPEHQRRRVG